MIQILKGRRRGFYKKELGLLSAFSSSVEPHYSNPYSYLNPSPYYYPKGVRINSSSCYKSKGLNRQKSTLNLPKVWINCARGGRRREEEVMFYPQRGLKLGIECILPNNLAKHKRSAIASTYLPRAIDSGGDDDKLLDLLDSSPYPLLTPKGGNLLDKIYNKFAISCKESRIETNTSFYGCFYLGPFEQGESVTIANALRRTLLSDLMGVAITSVEIEGAVHEYASLTGVRESVLDILLNLKEITLKQTTLSSSTTFTPQGQTIPLKPATDAILTPYLLTNPPPTKLNHKGVVLSKSKVNYLERKKKWWGNQVGYLRARGPGVIRASDLKLPPYIVCVDPEQYIATLSDDGVLNMKFFISEGKNYLIQVPNKNLDLNEIKKRRLFQKKMKQGTTTLAKPGTGRLSTASQGKSFVRYAPFSFKPLLMQSMKERGLEVTSGYANPKRLVGVKSFFNLRKQKTVFNDASNGNRLPIDAVFMPVTKVNYIIEPDEQSNDEQFNDSKSASTYGTPADLGERSSGEANSPSFGSGKNEEKHHTLFLAPRFSAEPLVDGSPPLRAGETGKFSLPPSFLSLTPEEVIAELQNLGLKRRSEEEQRAFSTLLVNPILKTQPPSLFIKHPFNKDIKMRRKRALPEMGGYTHNIKGPAYSKEQSQGIDVMSSPSFSREAHSSLASLSTNKDSLLQKNQKKKGLSDINFTFLHPAPFLSLQDKNKQRINETLNGPCEEKGQQVIFENKKQELLFFGKSQKGIAKEEVAGQEVFTKKDPLKFKIILEIWTNGSIHPRKALYDSFKSMITLFSRLQKVQILGSMLKSERFYKKLIENKFYTKNAPLAPQSPLISKKKLTSLPNPKRGSSKGGPFKYAEHIKEGLKKQSALLSKYPSGVLVMRDDSLLLTNSSASSLTRMPAYGVEAEKGQNDLRVAKRTKIKPLPTSLNKMVTGLQTSIQKELSGGNGGESADDKLPTLAEGRRSQRVQLDLIAIESLHLSLRSYTCLKRSNINTINDLMGYSKKQLIQIKNFGIHSLEEIQTCLGVLGFKLKQ